MIALRCQYCERALKVKPELAGKKVKCPGCGKVVPVPAPTHAPSNPDSERTVPPTSPPVPECDEPRTVPPLPQASEQPTNPSFDKPDVTQSPVPDDDHDSSLTDFLAPPKSDDELGRLGEFRILKILGHGGMGVVFMGEDPKLGRKVAIKAMLPHLAQSRSSHQRFLREAKSAAALEHMHIVPIFHVGEDRGAPFIVMPFLKGEPLDKTLQREEKLRIPEVLRIGREMAKGLAVAHKRGLVHRDIKPANVWLETSEEGHAGTVKILDFGLARAAAQESGLTQQGAIIGTPAYMAPEQARGDDVDARCDLWSLGVVLYRLCTGKQPFLGKDTVSTLMAVATTDPPPPIMLRADVPQELSDLVMQLLEKDIDKRIAAASDVVQAIKNLEKTVNSGVTQAISAVTTKPPASRSQTAERIEPMPTQSAPAPGRSRKVPIFMAAAAVLALAIAGSIFFFWSPQGTQRIELIVPGDKKGVIQTVDWALQFQGEGQVTFEKAIDYKPDSFTIEGMVRVDKAARLGTFYSFGQTSGVMLDSADGGTWRFSNVIIAGGHFGIQESPAVEIGRRLHLAAVADADGFSLYFDGKKVGKTPKGRLRLLEELRRGTKPLLGKFFDGVIDEVRISSVPRYQGNFTPPGRHVADAQTLALYHMDEGQGDVLTDSSGNGHHGKIVGAKWVKADGGPVAPPAGNYALEFSGGDNLVTLPGVAVAPQSTFTWEGWVNPKDRSNMSLAVLPNSDDAGLYRVALKNNGPYANVVLAGKNAIGLSASENLPPTGPFHLASCFNGNKWSLWVNGKKIHEGASHFGWNYHVKNSFTGRLGADSGFPIPPEYKSEPFQGTMDEIRISKSVRYTADFTPAMPFDADKDTLALYHCDEGEGDLLKDSSGNGHHGKIVGAKWVKVEGAPAPPAVVRHGLQFDGKGSHVMIDSLRRTNNEPRTIEAYLIPATVSVENKQGANVIGYRGTTGMMNLVQIKDTWKGQAVRALKQKADSSLITGMPGQAQVGVRTHVATIWDGSECRLFVDGKRVAVENVVGNPLFFGPFKGTILAASASEPIDRFWAGVMTEVRISKGILYDKDFTPAERFEPDIDTLALYHFDEGEGDVLKDSSGNGHHGKIVGAKWVKADGMPKAPARSVLRFDAGKAAHVYKLNFPTKSPTTMETIVTLRDYPVQSHNSLLAWSREQELHLGIGGRVRYNINGVKFGPGLPTKQKQLDLSSKSGYLVKDRPTHVAGVWKGTTFTLFVDGKAVASKEFVDAVEPWDMPLTIGGGGFIGDIRGIRISKAARYDQDDFVPPVRFEKDAQTLALYHCDEGVGETLTDASGNGHHGKFAPKRSPEWVKEGTPYTPQSPDLALDFGVDADAKVEFLTAINAGLPFAAEMVVTPRSARAARVFQASLDGFAFRLDFNAGVWSWKVDVPSKTGEVYTTRIDSPKMPLERTHIVAASTGKEIRLFINGRLVQETPLKNPRGGSITPMLGGRDVVNPAFDGTISAFRLSTSARYDADFDPPRHLTPDEDSKICLHFRDGGDGLVNDIAGDAWHGKIVGAKWVRPDGSAVPLPK